MADWTIEAWLGILREGEKERGEDDVLAGAESSNLQWSKLGKYSTMLSFRVGLAIS